MPYDPNKCRQLLSIAGAHGSNPAAEYIEALVEQLRGAEEAMAETARLRVKAEGDANRYASELETAQATIRRLREEKEAAATPAAATEKKKRVKSAEAPAATAAVIPLPAQAPAPTNPEPKRTRKPRGAAAS